MKRPTELISKIKHCFNGKFQDLHDYIIFLENLTKIQRAKMIEEIDSFCVDYNKTAKCYGNCDKCPLGIFVEQTKGDKK